MTLKRFKIIGPETTRKFDIEDDEMLLWYVIKISDHENPNRSIVDMIKRNLKSQNEVNYLTKGD